ncbi:MAG: iron-containing alcohol dehydrogenase [Thermodesulfobacteriota bacterium]
MNTNYNNLPSGRFTVQAQESIIFGQPAEKAVVAEADHYGAKHVFIFSTRSLSQLENGPLQRIMEALGSRLSGKFTAIRAHSPRQDVIAAATAARSAKADLLIAVGGGSVIDATKAIQMCLWLGLESPASMEPYRDNAALDIRRKIIPPVNPIRMITVSTTLSASEFTSTAGVTDTKANAKQSFTHRLLVPRSVVLDPAATLDTPDWLLFSTGIRSVDHAVESYCSPLANPATEALSLQGLRLLARALPKIKAEPHDLNARLEAQFGMWQAIAASAAGAGSGASHGIGYVLGATFGVAHGHTSCVMLPAVLRWNAQVNGERQRALAEAMGAPQQKASDLVASLVASLHQPSSLRAVNIKRDNFEEIAKRAMTYAQVRMNPRPIKSSADVQEILELAW